MATNIFVMLLFCLELFSEIVIISFQTMLPAFMCYFPSGCSMRQFQHYAQEASFGFFGRFMTEKKKKSRDFPFEKITTPLSLHYTTADKLADPLDVEILIPKLKSAIFVQRISTPRLNHIDLLWGRHAAKLIYSQILNLFQEYQ